MKTSQFMLFYLQIVRYLCYFILKFLLFLYFILSFARNILSLHAQSALRHCKDTKYDKIIAIKRVNYCYLHGIVEHKAHFP